MQASLIHFDDLPEAPAADAVLVVDGTTGPHQLQQGSGSSAAGAAAATADFLDLWTSTISMGQPVEAHPIASSDPLECLLHVPEHQDQQQHQQQTRQQHAPPQQRHQQQAAAVQEHTLQDTPSQEQHRQQHSQHLDFTDAQHIQVPAGNSQLQPHQDACQQHGKPQCTSCSSIDPSLLPVCERVACLGQLLQQHGAAQGEANASIRLLLATISAKQVKTRQLLAGIAAAHAAPTQQQQQPEQQQLQQQLQQAQQTQLQLQQQLAASHSELAAARAELAAAQAEIQQLKAAEAEQVELQFLRDAEVQQVRGSEQQAHAEIQGLQDRLLEAEEALSRLSASLPGNRGRRRHGNVDPAAADLEFDMAGVDAAAAGSPVAGASAAVSAFAADAAATAAVTAGGEVGDACLVTPVRGGVRQQLTQRSSLMTPDQQSIVQLKSWLQQSQSALMEAQDDLLAREAQVKELQREQELLTMQLQAQLQQEQGEVQAVATEQLLQQQRELVAARAALQDAQMAAESAAAQRDEVNEHLDELRVELRSLRGQLQQAEAARAAAVAAVQVSVQQEQQQEQADVGAEEGVPAAGTTADAERVAAAEVELLGARAEAAAAVADVVELQQQLQQLQEQLQEQQSAAAAAVGSSKEGVSTADAAGVDAELPSSQQDAQPVTAHAVEGIQDSSDQQQQQLQIKQQQQQQGADEAEASVGFELLKAVSEKQALQEELADTKQRLLLLLQLVRKAAAAATASEGQGKPKQQRQLPPELAGLLEEPAAAAADDGATASLNGEAAPPASAAAVDPDGVDELGGLLQLVSGLEARYCRSEHLQQLLLRGKEMQLLLENALQQVHLIKAAAGVTSCACPSEQEYQQLGAAARSAAGKGGSGNAAAMASPAAAAVPVALPTTPGLDPGLGSAAAAAPEAGVGAAAGNGGSSSFGVGELWHQPLDDGFGQLSADVDAGVLTGAEPDAFDLLLQPQQQQQGAAAGAGGCVGSSCSSDVLRVGSTAGSGHGVLDEGLSYDGLEGAWWNKSSVEAVTDLPDFLIKKS